MARTTNASSTRLMFKCWKLLWSGCAIAATASTIGVQRPTWRYPRTRHQPNRATFPIAHTHLASGKLMRASKAKGVSATIANGGHGRPIEPSKSAYNGCPCTRRSDRRRWNARSPPEWTPMNASTAAYTPPSVLLTLGGVYAAVDAFIGVHSGGDLAFHLRLSERRVHGQPLYADFDGSIGL